MYKRQVVLMLPIKNRLSSTATTTGVPSMRPVAVMTASFRPVSYTHLDVYKSQGQPSHLRRAMQALWPPKPKLLLSAY